MNVVWFGLEAKGYNMKRVLEDALNKGVKARRGRSLVHDQISDKEVRRFGRVINRLLGIGWMGIVNDI